jgi:hypothetical protein
MTSNAEKSDGSAVPLPDDLLRHRVDDERYVVGHDVDDRLRRTEPVLLESGEYTLTTGAPGGRSSARIRCDIAAPYGSCTCRAARSPRATCLQYCPTNVWKSRFCSGVNRSWAYHRISSMISDRSRDGMVGMAIPFGPATARSPRRRAARSCGPLPAACVRTGGVAPATGRLLLAGNPSASPAARLARWVSWPEKMKLGYVSTRRSDTATLCFCRSGARGVLLTRPPRPSWYPRDASRLGSALEQCPCSGPGGREQPPAHGEVRILGVAQLRNRPSSARSMPASPAAGR